MTALYMLLFFAATPTIPGPAPGAFALYRRRRRKS